MEDLEGKKLQELVALCKEKGIKGYSGKKKAEILELLKKSVPSVPSVPSIPASSPEQNPGKSSGKSSEKPKSKKSQVLGASPEIPEKVPKVKSSGSSSKPLGWKFPEVCPKIPEMFGMEEVISDFYKWLKDKPSVAYLYGPAGVGKTMFIWKLLEAMGVKGIEVESYDMNILGSGCSLLPRVAVWDDCEKPGKPPSVVKTHLIIIGRDKFTYVPKESIILRIDKPRTTSLAKWLLGKYPKVSIDILNNLCKINDCDIRHILLTLESGVFTDSEKDSIVQKDAFSATGALFNKGLSIEKRIENASLEPDVTLCLVHESLPKCSGVELEDVCRALECISYTDSLRHQEGRWLGVVATVSVLDPIKPPFLLFPQWYGKYSKTEKHKRWLSDWKSKGWNLDSMMAFRGSLLEKAENWGEELEVEELCKKVLKVIQANRLTYTNLFEELEEFLFEGCEIGDFDESIHKVLKKLSTDL